MKKGNKNLLQYEKNINKKYKNWKNSHGNFCDCNTCKQQDYYKKYEDYKKLYDKNQKPRGYLQEYGEYNHNNISSWGESNEYT